ncbi:winged helix-turn-helix domain-containing protein [Aquihabitans sp. McL0605]|uniref:winged helix-turn-helix domain-containing protein n=1 Tax=Aquihabitans sp. McL0605 TaxID=3415671 RepID=UPI003CF9EBAB
MSTGASGLAVARRSAPTVEVLRWPAQADRRPDLVASGRPCLWVLDTAELPPAVGPLEDWARTTDGERDVAARVHRLAGLAPDARTLAPGEACVDGDGMLHFGGQRISIPPTEATLLDRLATTPERVVSRDELGRLLWDGQPSNRSSLTSRIHTLRKRLRPVGLRIHAIRGHGFLLAADPVQPIEPVSVREPTRRTSWSSSSQPS